ncbi:MAG: hypothetical protein IKZ90_03245 [Clostridiales bacterium]|nr:hypothetical protein [Clostridiales bacterium]
MKRKRRLFALLLAVSILFALGEFLPLKKNVSAASGIPIDEDHFSSILYMWIKYQGKNVDKDQNGYLSQSECDSVVKIETDVVLEADSKKAPCTKGLGYFKNLEYLELYCCCITELDISQNPKLEHLNVASNGLTKLDVSHNPKLKFIWCSSNDLTFLDVSKNSELETLICYMNDITSLNVTKNTKLQYLSCYDNGLTSLNVTCNPALKTLGCATNKLTYLNVSKNPNLLDLSCYSNPLKTLDVTKNVKLKSLNCGYSQISSLNVTKNVDLERLEFVETPISSIDIRYNKKLNWLRSKRSALKSLDISSCPYLMKTYFDGDVSSSSDHYQYEYRVSDKEYYILNFPSGIPLTTEKTIPKISAVPAGLNKVKLMWNVLPGANGYLVYARKNGKYTYVGMTANNSFIDTKASETEYNFYWVYPFIRDVDGQMVIGNCSKYTFAKGGLSAVTNLSANGSTGKVTLSWTAALGADGYLIYGIRPGGKYGYIGMTSGTKYSDVKASASGWTFYWVIPYAKSGSTMVPGASTPYVYSKAR